MKRNPRLTKVRDWRRNPRPGRPRNRPKADPVKPSDAEYVLLRDRGCVVSHLVAIGAIPDPGPCRGRLTVAHIRDRRGGRMARRPPSIRRRLAAVCEGHHTDDPVCDRTDVRPVIDLYLERLEGPDLDLSRPWERIRRVRAAVDQEPG